MSYGKLAGCAKLLFGTHRRELEPSAARPSGQGALLGRVSTSRSAAIRRSERTTTMVPSLGAFFLFASERTCLKQTPIISPHGFWRMPGLPRRAHRGVPRQLQGEVSSLSRFDGRLKGAGSQDSVRRRVPALRSPGAMTAYLDSVLDFVTVELLGCALPRQKRVEPAVNDPG